MRQRNHFDRAVLEKADAAAKQLREVLLKRLKGVTRGAMSCGCGAIHHGKSEVVDITYTDINGQYAYMIGDYQHFSCHMREVGNPHNRDYDYSMSVSDFISWSELHVMFRDVFRPIGVPTEHLFAQPFTRGSGFWPSGRKALLTIDRPLFVRPEGDLSKSLWLDAQVLIQRDVPRYRPGLLVGCIIDHSDVRGYGDAIEGYNHWASLAAPLEFATMQFDLHNLKPIVKVNKVHEDGCSLEIETHAGVEFFTPESELAAQKP